MSPNIELTDSLVWNTPDGAGGDTSTAFMKKELKAMGFDPAFVDRLFMFTQIEDVEQGVDFMLQGNAGWRHPYS